MGDISRNRDGSTTISNPFLLRGTKSYKLSASHTNRNGLCIAMGFKEELPGYLTTSSARTEERVYLNRSGNFVEVLSQYDTSVATVTCLNSDSVLVLEDGNGNFYISKERSSHREPVRPVRPVEPVGSYNMHPKSQALSKRITATLRPLINDIGGYYASEYLMPIKEQSRTLNIRSVNGSNRRTILNTLYHLHSLVEKALSESGVTEYELKIIKTEIKSLIDSI
jgi:hypothetical protein